MKQLIQTYLGILFFLVVLPLAAEDYSFNHLSIDDGLSHISATNIQQDELGRIWIGTRDGLNVYDGNTVQSFRPIRGDSTSLLGLNIRDIHVDKNDIYVCTRQGISRLDLMTMKFQQFPDKNNESVVVYNDKVLIGSATGLREVDFDRGVSKSRSDVLPDHTFIRDLYVDHANILWMCANDGLYRYNSRTKTTKKLLDEMVSCVFVDSRKRIWAGTDGNGFFLMNQNYKVLKHFHTDNAATPIVNNYIRCIDEDSKGNIWIGTFLGLNILEGNQLSIKTIQHQAGKSSGLSHNSVYSFLNDQQGTMWVGSYFGGVDYYNPEYNIFTKYQTGLNNKEGTGFRVIGKMVEDENRNLWIATEGGGLDYFDRKSKTFKHYQNRNQPDINTFNNVKSIYQHSKDTLLIGAHLNGLFLLDLTNGKYTNFNTENSDLGKLGAHSIHDFAPYEGDYLLATNNSVLRFNIKTGKISYFFSDEKDREQVGDVIYTLFEDSFDNLWIGTEKNGLSRYNFSTKVLEHYEHNPKDLTSVGNNSILSIFEDHLFRLWVGTLGGGLNLYDRDQNNFKVISSEESGLHSNFVYGIAESRYGHLWILTSKGLSKYDVENQSFLNYEKSNGFPLNLMNEHALCLTSDGELFVGGISGLVSFKEKDIFKKNLDYNLLFSKLTVNNQVVNALDDTKILAKDIVYTQGFKLKPSQDIFAIQFSACNFVKNNQSTIQYMLEGFNNEWINANTSLTATYTNLDPGKYRFKIRAVDNLDKDVITQKSIAIKVLPPIYRTWYAYLVYLGLILLIIFFINKNYIAQIRLQDRITAEQREKEQLKALNQSKLKFFTNISHEFRTPLTLITGTLESVLEDHKTKPSVYRKLNVIHNSAIRLNNLISELLDFRKLDQGFLKLKVCENQLHPFLNEIFQSFVEYASYHKIEYNYSPPEAGTSLWFDRVQMEKVFYNLISNAFKLVDETVGKVNISLEEHDGYIEIHIADNGPGMAQEKINRIFDRFYQIDRLSGKIAGKGSGLGLALSKGIVNEHHGKIVVDSTEGVGTIFKVRLLKGNKHFKDADFVNGVDCSASTTLTALPSNKIQEEQNEELPENAPSMLIVEDNDDVRTMLVGLFKNTFNVTQAADGEAGMNKALSAVPDIIISDVMMPKLSGTEMCAKLKRNAATSHIPIVLLTARTAMEYKIEGLETGADEYITKPFNINMLRARVKNLLKNRYLLQEKFKSDPQSEAKEIASNSHDLKLLNNAREIIEQHIDDTEFDVNTFAREMGLGRTRLYSKIKGITGQTPNDFILSTRLKKAADMLMTNPDLNVSEVAYAVGFSTPRYFSRCFREHFGSSPSKYGSTAEGKDGGVEDAPKTVS